LDADHVFYSSSEALTNYPDLVVVNIHTSRRTVLGLDFPRGIPGTTASCYLSIPQNSMPHTYTSGHSTGDFCADISNRLVVLNVVSYGWGGYSTSVKQQQTLHISANGLLSYVRTHPCGGFVSWDAWAPGNVRVVPRCEVAHETITGMYTLCGMRALSDHIVKDRYGRPMICVYDYHRVRVRKALADGLNESAPTSEMGDVGMWTKMRRSLSTKLQEHPPPLPTSYVVPGGDKEMSCLVKEIPIPEGLLVTNLVCVLCEHAIILLEVSQLLRFFLPRKWRLADCRSVVGQEDGCSD
jgi:hypothetical protein